MIPLRLAPASAMLMLLAACGSPDTTNPDTAPVPLPRAWPRTPLYEAAYAPVAPGSDIEVAEALEPRITRRRGADSWIDISYPAYRATLYLSDLRFSSPAEASDAIDNRLEPTALNDAYADGYHNNDRAMMCFSKRKIEESDKAVEIYLTAAE